MYEIVMPQLSDSMDEGKLISWKKKVGEHVEVGEVIAEVESDKAIMEVQSFKAGTLYEIVVQEGEEAAIGTVIAKIDTGTKSEGVQKSEPQEKKAEKKPELKHKDSKQKNTAQEKQEVVQVVHSSSDMKNGISPKARAKAAAYGLKSDDIAEKISKKTLHASDVDLYVSERYFTPKALQLLDAYKLEYSLFNFDHKIDSDEVQAYIDAHEISLPKPLSSMQKAIIANVTASAYKPVFHLYESLDATLFEKHKEYSITVWLLKILAKVMMQHEAFRSQLRDKDTISVLPNASISLAVANEKDLYMPVIADVNSLSGDEIQTALATLKTKLQAGSFTQNDMLGSTFGISNLGMLGVERFDAMINKDDAAIIAIGAINDGKMAVTLTADHRLINGYEAGLFMRDVKKEAQNPLNFKEE